MTKKSDGSSRLHLPTCAYFLMVHAVGLAGLVYSFWAPWEIIVFACVLFMLGQLATTCGPHRLYAHATYEASKELQFVLAILFSMNVQGSMVYWSGWHRWHHRKEGTKLDPHCPNHGGFFHAHMGWVMSDGGFTTPPKETIAHLLDRDKYSPARWQHRHFKILSLVMGWGIPTFVGWLLGDWIGGLLVAGFTRLVFQYNLTWVINSVCHLWGERIGDRDATNVWWLGILTVGESYHANHHAAPGDYRIGRRWWEIDLGAIAIRFFERIGHAHSLKVTAG